MSDHHSTASIGGYRSTHRNPMPSGGGELYPAGTLGHKTILCLPLRADAVDVGPNALPFTNHGAVTFDATDGASLDGATQWLSTPDNVAFVQTGGWGIAWAAKVANDTFGTYFFLGKVSGDDFPPGLGFHGTISYNFGNSDIECDASDGVAATFPFIQNVAPLGVSHSFLVSFDPLTNEANLYIDGALVATDVYSGTGSTPGQPFNIGRGHEDGFNYLTGSVRDVVMWGRAPSGADAIAHYNGGLGHANGGLAVVV